MEAGLRKTRPIVDIERFEKRLQALEDQGLEVDVIGRGDRLLDLRRKLALGRILKKLILTHGGRQLVIALVDAPELRGDQLSLHLALTIQVGAKPIKLTRADKIRLESFLDGAIERTSRGPLPASVHDRRVGAHPRRRASSGT
jgi:hypothetical protein